MDDLFKALAMHIDEGVFVIRDRRFIFCNDAFARILGRHTNEVVGAEFTEVIAPEDLDMVADRYRRRWAGEQVPPEYEFRLLERDGETRVPVRLWVTLGDYEAAPATLGVVAVTAAKSDMGCACGGGGSVGPHSSAREPAEGGVPRHGARGASSVKSRRVRLVAVALLLVVFWAGFFVRDASFVLSVFGRFAGSPYLLGFTWFPLWSLAALVAALALLLSLLVDARAWPIWIVAAVLVGAMLLLRGLRFSVFVPEAAHRQFSMVDYLLWPGTLWVKWWALLAIGLVFAGAALVAFVLPELRRSPRAVKAG